MTESIETIVARMDERQQDMDKKLEKILTQTTLTNGRVSQLEAWRNRLKGIWMTVLITSTVIGFIISTALHFIK